jgi:galactosylxylosylprotein 3-beta-galactosyltransferase
MEPIQATYPNLKDGFSGALKSQSTFLVIMIISSPKNLDRRTAIRQTWLNIPNKYLRKDVLPLFAVGNENLSEEVSKKLDEENNGNEDLLVLPIQETYTTLTQKILASFVHIERNVNFSFLLKVDDDSFVNLAIIVEELRNSKYNRGLYWGFFDGRAPVQKKGKWAEVDYVICDR